MAEDYEKVYPLVCKETKKLVIQPLLNIKSAEIFDKGSPYIVHMNPKFLKDNFFELNTLRVPLHARGQFALKAENLRELLSSFTEVSELLREQIRLNESLFEEIEKEKGRLGNHLKAIRTHESDIDDIQEKLDLLPARGIIDQSLLKADHI